MNNIILSMVNTIKLDKTIGRLRKEIGEGQVNGELMAKVMDLHNLLELQADMRNQGCNPNLSESEIERENRKLKVHNTRNFFETMYCPNCTRITLVGCKVFDSGIGEAPFRPVCTECKHILEPAEIDWI